MDIEILRIIDEILLASAKHRLKIVRELNLTATHSRKVSFFRYFWKKEITLKIKATSASVTSLNVSPHAITISLSSFLSIKLSRFLSYIEYRPPQS